MRGTLCECLEWTSLPASATTERTKMRADLYGWHILGAPACTREELVSVCLSLSYRQAERVRPAFPTRSQCRGHGGRVQSFYSQRTSGVAVELI
jgi:hypothetical protein